MGICGLGGTAPTRHTGGHQSRARPPALCGLDLARPGQEEADSGHPHLDFMLRGIYSSHVYPDVVPEFMAYMLTIIRDQKEYEELAWRTYDEAYRDAAASSGNKQWSKVDDSIFAKVFTGRVREDEMVHDM